MKGILHLTAPILPTFAANFFHHEHHKALGPGASQVVVTFIAC